jgi:hypothetical protein
MMWFTGTRKPAWDDKLLTADGLPKAKPESSGPVVGTATPGKTLDAAPSPIVIQVSPRRWAIAVAIGVERWPDGRTVVVYRALEGVRYEGELTAVAAAVGTPGEPEGAAQ